MKLADMLALGASGVKPVGVQISPPAQIKNSREGVFDLVNLSLLESAEESS